jgi:hypothetical protein
VPRNPKGNERLDAGGSRSEINAPMPLREFSEVTKNWNPAKEVALMVALSFHPLYIPLNLGSQPTGSNPVDG